jgi:hypothetical protein
MDFITVPLLQYEFRFRLLSWREEAEIASKPKQSRQRSLLASALAEVSGLKIKSPEEADKLLAAVPPSVLRRVFVLWRGGGPAPRKFMTQGLYRAPDPMKEKVSPPASIPPPEKGIPISPEELATMKASKMRGATRASESGVTRSRRTQGAQNNPASVKRKG